MLAITEVEGRPGPYSMGTTTEPAPAHLANDDSPRNAVKPQVAEGQLQVFCHRQSGRPFFLYRMASRPPSPFLLPAFFYLADAQATAAKSIQSMHKLTVLTSISLPSFDLTQDY